MKYKNLVITQNAKLFQSIRPILICADLDVSQATTYQKALELLSCFHYVLVVADLSFPDIDGIKLIHSLRRLAQVPILAFTSKYTTEEEIQVLFAGADDYLDCGVVLDPERCLAHITAITRRYLWKDRPERAAVLIPGNGLKINLKRRRAYFHGENLRLTPKQFIVLQILVERMGEVVTKEELCEAAWETDHDVYADDALKYHVRELGQHGMENLIETVWGVGYQLSLEGNS